MSHENQEIIKTIKALTKKEEIKLDLIDADDNFFNQNQNLTQNNYFKIPKTDNLRALSDLAACYHIFHDQKIHQKHQKDSDFEQKILDNFEKIRLLGQASTSYRGILQNNLQKINNDLNFSIIDQNAENFQLILLDAILKNRPKDLFPEKLQESINITKQHFKPEIIKKITEIAKTHQNQEEFALKTTEFLEFLQKNQENNEKEEKTPEKPQEKPQKNPQKNQQKEQPEEPKEPEQQEEPKKQEPQEQQKTPALPKPQTIKKQPLPPTPQENQIEFHKSYQIYTNKFDEVILPQKLVDKTELEILRLNLDTKMENLSKISKRLTLKLKQKLIAKQNFTIEPSESQGVLDRKKLTQIVLNPFEKNFFIKENHHNYQNTVITILLDNSGSMRGTPIVMTALACEIIASILQNFSIKTEILGFTTADWRGGKSRKMWERNQKPKNPGRLNDLRHIIYKSANQNFKKARNNLGLMLKEGILKENIDGEALLWAKSRLLQREETRKILMVISDGTPVDDSTNSKNDEEILTDHLKHTIQNIQKQGKIELIGVGIGHHVGDFYQNSIAIKNINDLGDVMIEKLVELL